MSENKYGSRKFIITSACIVVTFLLAFAGKMDANVALVLSACIASYNLVNGWVEKKNE